MGLDMYAYSVKGSSKISNTPDGIPKDDIVDGDLHYWRKHPALHGYMQVLWAKRTGVESPNHFNCKPLELTVEDLDALQKRIELDALPHTEGFFFGQSTGEERADDLEFIRKAREVIAAGDRVFYDSWW